MEIRGVVKPSPRRSPMDPHLVIAVASEAWRFPPPQGVCMVLSESDPASEAEVGNEEKQCACLLRSEGEWCGQGTLSSEGPRRV